MPLTSIQGTFRVVGASPDGDSVRFYPDDPAAWTTARVDARTNATGGAQLRLDAIDALETHYRPQSDPAVWHQPVELGGAAADRLLALLGFASVSRDQTQIVTAATPVEVRGHILTRFADKYGRPVAFAFAGESEAADLSQVWLDAVGLAASANHALLAAGLAYPTFYSRLYVDLRAALAAVTVTARTAGLGLWPSDSVNAGFQVTSRAQLQDELVIMPKVFRRLADYLGLDASGAVDLAGFGQFLTTLDDLLFTVPEGWSTNLASLIEVTGQTVRLTVPPEQIVFLET